MTKREERIIEMAKEAYIGVMGINKWNSLTDREKHDAVMMMVKGMLKALN